MSIHEQQIANEHFNKARFSELISRILRILKPESHELLSFYDVRKALRSKGENYRGYQAVPIDKIIGSEGRYRDFNRQYLPKREHSRTRWTSIDRAHQKDITLPAVNLYEIFGYYFVRDGNHRVSVARSMGMKEIDAIIVSLDTEIPLKDEVTKSSLKLQVIEYEKKEFDVHTRFDTLFPDIEINFTETGRYGELVKHFESHLRYLLSKDPTVDLKYAIRSWREHIYLPIVEMLKKGKILSRFPKRTFADMYIWIIKHRDELRREHRAEFAIQEVAHDLSKKYGKNKFERLLSRVRRVISRLKR